MFGWLVVCLVGWLAGCLFVWLVGWLFTVVGHCLHCNCCSFVRSLGLVWFGLVWSVGRSVGGQSVVVSAFCLLYLFCRFVVLLFSWVFFAFCCCRCCYFVAFLLLLFCCCFFVVVFLFVVSCLLFVVVFLKFNR